MTDILVEPDDVARKLREYVRAHPDVRKDQYSGYDDPVEGACYVLSECYFHANGGQDSDLDIYCLSWSDVDEQYDGTHWFLRRNAGEEMHQGPVIDLSLPTPAAGDNVPWTTATRRAFLTGYEPSDRTQRVLDALEMD